uniref:Uncharacterized protein n=1 Tax=Cacopsylla melanoneura TaxID=428564 RepID=A0A8D8TYH7_9HEMI
MFFMYFFNYTLFKYLPINTYIGPVKSVGVKGTFQSYSYRINKIKILQLYMSSTILVTIVCFQNHRKRKPTITEIKVFERPTSFHVILDHREVLQSPRRRVSKKSIHTTAVHFTNKIR